MTTPALRFATGAATGILTAACASNTPGSITTPSTNTFHAEVADPAGDAVASPAAPNPPDLVHATVDVSSGAVTFTIQFASFTLDRQSTRLNIELDTDQNPATGIVGAAGLGIDYVLDLWGLANQAKIQQAMPAACAAGGSATPTPGPARSASAWTAWRRPCRWPCSVMRADD
jgi:hypothetical protein